MSQTARNQLGSAVSPYLLQHRDNPVHWREWTSEALGEAAREDKPILLSVGYAACHWCHVMAHESFEDPETAAVMNRLFVNVKVDREERPDIDHLYMSALHAMGEQGGWPMTMFLTPAGKPFYGGTYYPRESAHGRPGFRELLQAVATAWAERRPRLDESAEALSGHLETILSRRESAEGPGLAPGALAETAVRIAGLVDARTGGLRGAPKFPNAPYFELLARSAFPAGPATHRDAFLRTLEGLCEGGIYDHLGGGLHRYSVDDRWLVPHFEKMLYDNALFLRHLVWGWRATGRPLFRQRIAETVAFLAREMRVPGGGFAASLDADSADRNGHMEEGAFYVWSRAELDEILGPEAADFAQRYDVSAGGNFEGSNVLSRLAGTKNAVEPEDEDRFAAPRAVLFEARTARARPARDDKVLADWNGLAIRALAEVGAALGDTQALRLAREAFAFVTEALVHEERLHHAARAGMRSGPALSADYGALLAAAAALYAATLDPVYLAEGRRLAAALAQWHGDGDGGHFMTARDADDVMIRLRGDTDEAVPAPTALVIEGLTLLAQASGDPALHAQAEQAARAAGRRIADQPGALPGILNALDGFERQSELALFGFRSNPGFAAMDAAARETLDLARLDIRSNDPAALSETHALAALRPERFPAAVLCRDRACRAPIHDPVELAALLGTRGA